MSVYPTATQVLFVRALLAPDDQFSALWEQWKAVAGPYEDLDHGSLRLFPFAYRKLLRLLPEDGWITVCRNAYRTSWLKNSLLIHEAGRVMDALTQSAVPFMVLKGGAFISLYYGNDIGVRTLDDVDIMMPVRYFSQAIRDICSQDPNYSTHTDIALFQPDLFHEVSLYTPSGILDMHCHLVHGYLREDDWMMITERTQHVSFDGRSVVTLSDSYHLVHICAHAFGFAGKDGVQLKWIIDAALIIGKGHVDWNFVIRLAQRMRIALSVRVALGYLRERGFVQVPTWVIAQLEKVSVPFSDKRIMYLESQDTHTRIIPAIELYWWRYARSLSRPYTLKNSAKQAVKFVMFLCQTPSYIAILGIVPLRFFQLVGRFLRRSLSINFLF